MKKLRTFLKVFIFVLIGACVGDIIQRYASYVRHPEKYLALSSPWYTSIIISVVFTTVIVLVCAVLYFILGRIIKKRSVPIAPNADAHKWEEAKLLLKSGQVNVADVVGSNAKTRLYYSTPAGQDSFGNERFWILESDDGKKYYPTFSTLEGAKEFFEKTGRHGFILIEGDLKSHCKSISEIEIFREVGVVIDPHLEDAIKIPYNIRL